MNQQSYLLDTNICVFYLRGKFDVDKRIDHVGWENCFISEITMLELKMGAELSMSAIANDMICVTDNTKDFIRFQDIRLETWINR